MNFCFRTLKDTKGFSWALKLLLTLNRACCALMGTLSPPGDSHRGPHISGPLRRQCREVDTCCRTNVPSPQFCLQDGVTVSEGTCYVMQNTRGPSLQVPPKQHSGCQGAVPGLLPEDPEAFFKVLTRILISSELIWSRHIPPVKLTPLSFSRSLSKTGTTHSG